MSNFQERQKVFSELAKRIDLNVSLADAALDEIVSLRKTLQDTKVELRKSVENEGKVCGDCDGSGWQENRVEGRHPCTCMTEAEPYQLLELTVLKSFYKEVEQIWADNIGRDCESGYVRIMEKLRTKVTELEATCNKP